jgi:membrane fusion protein, multidrug efflux system
LFTFAPDHRQGTLLAAVLLVLMLAGCTEEPPRPEEARPVRAIVLAAGETGAASEFAGEVRPRYESRLGFRVGGKIAARKVDVGALVKRGQVLMQLDPQDLRLGQAQAQANLRAAETARDLAAADLKRYQELRAQNFVSQAVLDARQAAYRQAQAGAEAARAGAAEQGNQAAYASLVADADGVVTAIDAEAGQVVAAGTPVVRVVRTDEKEVVIGVPEDRVDEVRNAEGVTVRLWAEPGRAIAGRVREIAPAADPATRTYAVKVAVPADPSIRLGMTAAVQLRLAGAAPRMLVPLTALVQDRGRSAVWVVDKGVAHLVPVQVGEPAGNEIALAGGVREGQTVVTAGVHVLSEGQKVRILSADVARRADADAQLAAGGAVK